MAEQTSERGGGRRLGPWLGVLVVGLLVTLFAWRKAAQEIDAPADGVGEGSGAEGEAAGEGGDDPAGGGAVARVRGQVFIESWPEPPPTLPPPPAADTDGPAVPEDPDALAPDAQEASVQGRGSGGPAQAEPQDAAPPDPDLDDASVGGTAGEDPSHPRAGETDGPAPSDDPPDDPPDESVAEASEPWPVIPEGVEPQLVHPPADECRIEAWQEGTAVSDVTPCTDDEGNFEVALHPGASGRTAFSIEVAGRLRAVVEVDVPPGAIGRLPPVALGLGQTLAGQVVDVRGEPVPGATLTAMPWPNLGEPEPWRATADAAGAFVFDTLPPGPITVQASAAGFAESVVETLAPDREVLVTLGGLIDLRGRVVGAPQVLARTKVRLEGSAVWPALETPCLPDGTFEFAAIPDGVYALEAVAPGTPALASIPLENVTPELEIVLALTAAVPVPVRVVTPGGDPVEAARVTLGNASVGLLSRVGQTDADGRLSLGPVVPGPYIVRADADGWLPAEPLALTARLPEPDAPIETLTLVLLQPGTIEGTVVDEGGRPVGGALVEATAEHLVSPGQGDARARMFAAAAAATGSLGVTVGPVPEIPLAGAAASPVGESTRADASGRFTLSMLAPGRYELVASHGRFARSEPTVVALPKGGTKAGVELVLRTGHRLTGRVRTENGRPLAGLQASLDDGTLALTDEYGSFDLGLVRGRVRVVVRGRGIAPIAARADARRGSAHLELVAYPAQGRLHGRVEGENGEALVDARVTLHNLDDLSATRVAWTDARGVWRIEDLPPGAAELEVQHGEHVAATRRVVIDPDPRGVPAVDTALVKGWATEVEVLAVGTRAPVEGARVSVGERSATTDADGVAHLQHLIGAAHSLEVEAVGHGVHRGRVTRARAADGRIRVELEQGGGLSGRVTDYRGDPVPGVDVVITDSRGTKLATARTGAGGTWSADGLAEGDYVATARVPEARADEVAEDALETDVRRGHVTRGVDLRLDRL